MDKKGEILIYQNSSGNIKMDVQLHDETVWLTQDQMALLFGKDRTTISRHIGNIFKERELEEKVVCEHFAHTTQHGAIKGKSQTQSVKYFNLDTIISVGYRVNNVRATKFRRWATQVLRQYALKIKILKKKLDSTMIGCSLFNVRLDKPLYLVQAQIRRELLGGD